MRVFIWVYIKRYSPEQLHEILLFKTVEIHAELFICQVQTQIKIVILLLPIQIQPHLVNVVYRFFIAILFHLFQRLLLLIKTVIIFCRFQKFLFGLFEDPILLYSLYVFNSFILLPDQFFDVSLVVFSAFPALSFSYILETDTLEVVLLAFEVENLVQPLV